jgi:hypothetical protein
MCRWRATYRWKALNEGYNFSLDLTSILGLRTKLWASKVMGIPILGILGIPSESPKTKWHLGVGHVARHKVCYKGEVVVSPKSKLWWVLWIRVCPWFVRGLKCFNYALTNLLFGLCRSMWVINLLVNLPSPHLGAPTRPSTFKMLQVKECAQTPSPSIVFIFGLVVESIKELGGVSSLVLYMNFYIEQPLWLLAIGTQWLHQNT